LFFSSNMERVGAACEGLRSRVGVVGVSVSLTGGPLIGRDMNAASVGLFIVMAG